jgi:hypothetical protein
MQVPDKEWRLRRGKEGISIALNRGPGFATYLSLQYKIVLLGTVIWFSHIAQKFKKLAMSNSVSSEDVDGLLAPLCPEPNLVIETLALDVPRRCKVGRVDLDLET